MIRERDRLSKTDPFDVPKREVVSVSRRTLLLGARERLTFCVKTGMLTTDADANAADAQKWIDAWKGGSSGSGSGADTPEARAKEAQSWIDAWKSKR